MSFIIGLTGSIGMGKSTTASLFAAEGIPVWDADAAVHRLYDKNGAAVKPIHALFPSAVVDNAVDRSILKQWIGRDPTALSQIEAIVHPLVAKDREDFIQKSDAPVIVLDIPLLFEIDAHEMFDMIVVVSTNEKQQKQRVLDRGNMTEAQFLAILAKQMPDREKRSRADVVINTDTLQNAKTAVLNVIAQIKERQKNA